METILITGGAGFIGSHTCVELLKDGYSLVVLDNFTNSTDDVIKAVKTISGRDMKLYSTNVLDTEGLDSIFKQNAIDAVVHFAGLKAVCSPALSPIEYYNANVVGTVQLLRTMEKHGCKRLINSSTAAIYESDSPVPINEEQQLSSSTPYGVTKIAVERMLMDTVAFDSEWSIISLRSFNPIGAHHSGLIGENPSALPNNLLPYVCKVATGDLHCLNVYGGDYQTPDGTAVRDYVHVMDVAAAFLPALKHTFKHTGFEAINLGTGKGISVMELVTAFEKASGVRIPTRFSPRRAGDYEVCYADIRKARAILGWEATRDIDLMCEDTWRFVKSKMKPEATNP